MRRWLYLALVAKESLVKNSVSGERWCVVAKRPTELRLRDDVPIACNLLICDLLEDGLLSCGEQRCLTLAVHHSANVATLIGQPAFQYCSPNAAHTITP